MAETEPGDLRYIESRLDALDRHFTAELASLRRETDAAEIAATKAIEAAAKEATERLLAHNGLIDQMRSQAQLFATRESVEDRRKSVEDRLNKMETFQARLLGASTLIAVIGIANFVKIWTG